MLELKEDERGGEGAPEFEGHVDFVFFLGDDFGSSSHASEVVAGVAIVLLDGNGVFFADDVSFGRQHFSEGIPVVGIKDAVGQVLDFVVKSSERLSITTADNPRDGFTCSASHRFEDPFFVFFDPTKCHISSNSISRRASPPPALTTFEPPVASHQRAWR